MLINISSMNLTDLSISPETERTGRGQPLAVRPEHHTGGMWWDGESREECTSSVLTTSSAHCPLNLKMRIAWWGECSTSTQLQLETESQQSDSLKPNSSHWYSLSNIMGPKKYEKVIMSLNLALVPDCGVSWLKSMGKKKEKTHFRG